MAKFSFNPSFKRRICNTQDMKIGQMAQIIYNRGFSKYKELIILRHSKGFVCLNDPEYSWSEKINLDVKLLEISDSITLTQED